MVRNKILTDAELASLKAVIGEVEKRTSGEIVVLVVPRSDRYLSLTLSFALVGWAIASAVSFFFHGWALSLSIILEGQLLGMALGAGLAFCPPFARFVARKTMDAKVNREAMAQFAANGLHRTREHTGILIYLSLLEHKVVILADKGIHEKASELWDKEVAHIIKGIHEGRTAQFLSEAIREMGAYLAKYFPRRADDTNELPDDVIT